MTDINNNQNSHDNIHDIININNDNNNNNQNDDEIDKSKINISEQNMKKKKGKENWQFICHPINKEAGLEIIMKPYKHVVKHTTKLIRGMSATYQCTVHVACQHSYKLVEKAFPDHIQWTLSELNSHSDIPAPKPRGIDPIIRAKVDEFAIMGASPMHILESLSAIGDFKGVELPTRDQISNRIHGRESKKRKLQMEAALNNQRNNNQSSFNYLSRSISSTSPPSSSSLLQHQQQHQQQQHHRTQHQFQQQFYQPIIQQQQQQLQQQSTITQSNNELPSNHIDYDINNIDSYEQAYLDMFGPQLLYHSVYYPEYGLGMVVSSPTDVMIPPLNLSYATNNNNNNNFNNNINNPHHSIISNMTNFETVTNTSISSISPSSSLTNSTLSSGDDINISNDSQNFHSSSTNSSTTSLPIISTSISVPLAGSSIPITIQPTFPPQWTLLFLHTPPDHNGLYMQCPLGCSGCINGKIHLYVNRTILLAGLMGAVEIANSNSYVPEDVLHCYDDHHHQCQQQPLSQLHQHQQQLPQQQQLSPSKQFYDITSKTSSSPMFFPSFVNYNNNNNDNNNNDNLINNSNNSININTNINNNISDTIQQ